MKLMNAKEIAQRQRMMKRGDSWCQRVTLRFLRVGQLDGFSVLYGKPVGMHVLANSRGLNCTLCVLQVEMSAEHTH